GGKRAAYLQRCLDALWREEQRELHAISTCDRHGGRPHRRPTVVESEQDRIGVAAAAQELRKRDAADAPRGEARAPRPELRHIDLMKHVCRHWRQPAYGARKEPARKQKVMWQPLAHDSMLPEDVRVGIRDLLSDALAAEEFMHALSCSLPQLRPQTCVERQR